MKAFIKIVGFLWQYSIAGIIDEVLHNFVIWQNLCDSSNFKIVINNYVIILQSRFVNVSSPFTVTGLK